VFPQIEKDYIQTGKVKYFFLDFPLESIHKKALKAHEAANCAGEQGKYWEMHDLLLANQSRLDLDSLTEHAAALRLDLTAFRKCLDSEKYVEEIRRDISEGKKAGVRVTPTFLLGFLEANGTKIRAVQLKRGVSSYSHFKIVIERLLSSSEAR